MIKLEEQDRSQISSQINFQPGPLLRSQLWSHLRKELKDDCEEKQIKYLVFPEGYDPVIASGPPNDFDGNVNGCFWTEEDTEKHIAMESEATIWLTKPPTDRYYMAIESEIKKDLKEFK
jgi:hypothetical protein